MKRITSNTGGKISHFHDISYTELKNSPFNADIKFILYIITKEVFYFHV